MVAGHDCNNSISLSLSQRILTLGCARTKTIVMPALTDSSFSYRVREYQCDCEAAIDTLKICLSWVRTSWVQLGDGVANNYIC